MGTNPLVVENNRVVKETPLGVSYRLDIFVSHYTGMTNGEPRFISLVVPEFPFTDREEAVLRAQQVTKDGICWGDTTVTCYGPSQILRVIAQPEQP